MASFLSIIFTVFMLFPFTRACLSTGGGGGTAPIPSVPCPPLDKMAMILKSNDVELQSEGFGAVPPKSTCTPCDGGKFYYYDSGATPVPHATEPLESIGSLSAKTCPKMCICNFDGTCYHPTDDSVVATFWPYCSNDICANYVMITAKNDLSGFISMNGELFSAGAQIDENYNSLPVTDPSYLKAATISCNGCMSLTCQLTS